MTLADGDRNVIAQLKRSWLTPRSDTGAEQRGSPREKVFLPAKVALGGGAVDCAVVDISETGARLHAPSVLRLPDKVHLLILSEGLLIHADRVWARFPLCGLKFITFEEIEDSTHPQARPLQEAWRAWRDGQRPAGG
jgi:hypothetical protein